MLATLSIRFKVTAIATLVAALFVVLCGAALLATRHNRHQLSDIRLGYDRVANVALPLSKIAFEMKLHITQVQQHLQDISATRGLDNLDSGFKEAERAASQLQASLFQAKALASRLGNAKLNAALGTVELGFEPFHSIGIRMAKAYVEGGPSSGNPMMREFDDLADRLRLALADVVGIADELMSSADGVTSTSIAALSDSSDSQLNLIFLLSCIAFVMTALIAHMMRLAVSTPIRLLAQSMETLAQGKIDQLVPLTERENEIGGMARAVEVFRRDAIERLRLSREAQLLSEFNDWLQSAKSERELYDMIADVLGRLLKGSAGSLYIYANSRDVLECAKSWNGDATTPSMHPDECWGLRRGRTYTRSNTRQGISFPCGHVHNNDTDTCCVPILAHGETVGLLHLQSPLGRPSDEFEDERRLGIACAEQISLAIANIKLREQLRDQSIRDPLTGLYNRRFMLDTCRREFARARRNAHHVSILSLDIDHFKMFNDNHGHDAGDAVLRIFGECLRSAFRDDDVPCRFGGEEFVVVLPACEIEEAAMRAEELRRKTESLVVRYADGQLPRITVSVGVSVFPMLGSTPTEVLKAADDALYLAKSKGRNCVVVSGDKTTITPTEASPAALAA